MNPQKMLIFHIRDLGVDCYKTLPENVARPVARVSLLGGVAANSSSPVWLGRATLQVDVWGETDEEADEKIMLIRSSLLEAPRNSEPTDYGVFSFVAAEWPMEIPDSDWPTVDGQPGPRYSMTVRVSGHP